MTVAITILGTITFCWFFAVVSEDMRKKQLYRMKRDARWLIEDKKMKEDYEARQEAYRNRQSER